MPSETFINIIEIDTIEGNKVKNMASSDFNTVRSVPTTAVHPVHMPCSLAVRPRTVRGRTGRVNTLLPAECTSSAGLNETTLG
jgi:hypothetical protein